MRWHPAWPLSLNKTELRHPPMSTGASFSQLIRELQYRSPRGRLRQCLFFRSGDMNDSKHQEYHPQVAALRAENRSRAERPGHPRQQYRFQRRPTGLPVVSPDRTRGWQGFQRLPRGAPATRQVHPDRGQVGRGPLAKDAFGAARRERRQCQPGLRGCRDLQ